MDRRLPCLPRTGYYQSSDTETENFDRLIQSYTDGGRPYAAGERLAVEHVFHLPHRDMGIRNPYMHLKKATVRSFWMLKVRLALSKGHDVWREYEMPIAEEGEALLRHVQSEWPEGQFEIHLQYNSGRGLCDVSKALEPILPHLRIGGGADLYRTRPCLLRENLTEQEAEAIKERLAAAGVSVQIRQRQPGEER